MLSQGHSSDKHLLDAFFVGRGQFGDLENNRLASGIDDQGRYVPPFAKCGFFGQLNYGVKQYWW